MNDVRISELREALLAVLSTAASMGIDVDLLAIWLRKSCWMSEPKVELNRMRPVQCIS